MEIRLHGFPIIFCTRMHEWHQGKIEQFQEQPNIEVAIVGCGDTERERYLYLLVFAVRFRSVSGSSLFFPLLKGESTLLPVDGGFKYFFFHPDPWGNDPIWLAHIFQLGGSTTN